VYLIGCERPPSLSSPTAAKWSRRVRTAKTSSCSCSLFDRDHDNGFGPKLCGCKKRATVDSNCDTIMTVHTAGCTYSCTTEVAAAIHTILRRVIMYANFPTKHEYGFSRTHKTQTFFALFHSQCCAKSVKATTVINGLFESRFHNFFI
jgi:hypothetical protein